MSSVWGRQLKVSLFGASHGPAVGVVIDGLPAGFEIDMARIENQLRRRAPGGEPWKTARLEADVPEILSGLYRGKTTGAPLAAMFKNTDARSGDYDQPYVIRPGHADLVGLMRYNGANDPRGGGHFSGRLTCPLTFAGSVAMQVLQKLGCHIVAHVLQIGSVLDTSFESFGEADFAQAEWSKSIAQKPIPTIQAQVAEDMMQAILSAKALQDSVGGVVEVVAWGFPAGIGHPIFAGLEPHLASLFFAVPAVKGVSFGAGFDVANRLGSENNDVPILQQDSSQRIRYQTNHSGGAEGGITTGMPILAKIAIKPTPTIGKAQESIDLGQMTRTMIEGKGRHDPCIVPRAVPVMEAAMAIGLLDLWLMWRGNQPNEGTF